MTVCSECGNAIHPVKIAPPSFLDRITPCDAICDECWSHVSFDDKKLAHPVVVRSAFSLAWGAAAVDDKQLLEALREGLRLSPIGQCQVSEVSRATPAE